MGLADLDARFSLCALFIYDALFTHKKQHTLLQSLQPNVNFKKTNTVLIHVNVALRCSGSFDLIGWFKRPKEFEWKLHL